MNLAWWLERTARERPDADALVHVATGERVSYAELAERADRIGSALRGDADVQRDEVVATIMPDDPWHVAVLFGAMKIGAVFSGYNRMLATAKFAEDAARSRVRTLLVGDEYVDAGREVMERVDSIERVIPIGELVALADARRQTVRVEPRLNADMAAVNFTGGSGGSAKGVVFTHGTLGASTLTALMYDGLSSRDSNLSFISLYHSGGIHDAVKLVMAGATNILTGGWNADLAVRLLREHRPTWIYFLVATMARDLMRHPEWGSLDLTGVHTHIAGEVVPPEVQRAWMDKGARVMNAYGLTETMPIAVTKTAFVYGDDLREPLGCSSRPIRDLVDVVLKDPDTGATITEPGVRGEICVRGDNVTPGYHNDPERTAAAFDAEGFLHTKDLAHVDEDGWFWIQGRTDDIINTGGEKLSLLEVEEALRQHPLVVDVACVGVAHERFGELPAALVVTSEEIAEEDLAARLDAHCLKTLERWKRPRLYGRLAEVPRTFPKRTKDQKALKSIVAGVSLREGEGVATLVTKRAGGAPS
jgi:acyl-CoA synthetase (AMP-forming)/AMP-acid ligase II